MLYVIRKLFINRYRKKLLEGYYLTFKKGTLYQYSIFYYSNDRYFPGHFILKNESDVLLFYDEIICLIPNNYSLYKLYTTLTDCLFQYQIGINKEDIIKHLHKQNFNDKLEKLING